MSRERLVDGRWVPVEDAEKKRLEARIAEIKERLAKGKLSLEEQHRLFKEEGLLEQKLGIESDESKREHQNPNRGLGHYL